MELPAYVSSFVIRRTGERKYVCNRCPVVDHHGDYTAILCHLSSSFHKNRIMQHEAMFCKACNKQFNFASKYAAHIKTKKHKQIVDPSLVAELKCDVCNVNFTCKADEIRHLATNKHAKNAKTDSFASKPENCVSVTVVEQNAA